MRLEWRALARALGASGAARTSAIADALAFRAARHHAFPTLRQGARCRDQRGDRHLHAIRHRVGRRGGRDPARYNHLGRGRDGDILHPHVRVRVWSRLRAVARRVVSWLASEDHRGERFWPAALSSGWRDRGAGRGRRGCPYDGAQVRAAEEQRDREQQAIIAELRRRYVDGPVLIVPRAGSGSSNSMGATVIPGAGTVFRAMANKGAWGFFDAQGGAMVSVDEETISLPAPVIVDATTLKGDGWTATVGRGGPYSRAHGRDRSASCGNDRSAAPSRSLVLLSAHR